MSSLAILVAAAAAGFTLAHWLKIPVIPLLVLFGMSLSYGGLVHDTSAFQNVLGLGLAFLVYSAGIELNPRRFEGKLEAVIWTATVQFGVLSAVGFVLALLLGFGLTSALCLAGAMGTSSTLVVVHQLQRRIGSLRTFGRLAIGVLLAQDLAIIIVIVVLVSLPGGVAHVAKAVAGVLSIGLIAFFAQRWFFPWVIRRPKLDEELLLLVLLATLFVFSGIAHFLGLPYVVGAFFAGFSLSAFPVNGVARSLLSSLSSFFRSILFTAMGALLTIPSASFLAKALILVVVVLILTPVLVTALAEWKGRLSSKNAVTCGLLLAQTSEFSLVLGLYAQHIGLIDSEVMSVITIVAVVTMTATPVIASHHVSQWLLKFHPLRQRFRTETDLRDHVLMLGCGAGGVRVAKPILAEGRKVVVVDQDPIVVRHLAKEEIPCIPGDATDEKVLMRAGIQHAKLLLVNLPSTRDCLRILRSDLLPNVPVIVSVFEEEHARDIEEAGGIVVLTSHASADSFMTWFESLEASTGSETGRLPASSQGPPVKPEA